MIEALIPVSLGQIQANFVLKMANKSDIANKKFNFRYGGMTLN